MKWAVNPVALAQLLTRSAERALPPGLVPKMLGDAFGDDDVETVLYGTAACPGLIRLLEDIRGHAAIPPQLDAALAHPLVRLAVERLGRDKVAAMLPYLILLDDAAILPPGNGPAVEPIEIRGYEPLAALEANDLSWRDPVQGVAWDCYLVAAMISAAWSRPALWRARLSAATGGSKTPGMLRFSFHGASGDAPPIEMAPLVPVGATRMPLYARSSTAGESWPSLVEKAYVVQRCRPGGEPTKADYLAIDGPMACFPHEAARMLLGGAADFVENWSGGTPPWDVVRAHSAGADGVPRVPVMAWTGAEDMAQCTPADWQAAGLQARHAYAVLGLMTEAGQSFVVLRNPYGWNVTRGDHARGPWHPVREGGTPDDIALDVDGVFALPAARFNRHFAFVSWTDPEA